MHRLLTFVAAYIISGAMAFAQGTATGQAPARGTQSSGNSVSSTPNSNSTSPSGAQGQASRTPSSPNQALPGDSNPANATTRDAQANGSAQSFLAAPEKHAAMDFAHAIKTGEFVIQNARQQHESIGFNVRGMN